MKIKKLVVDWTSSSGGAFTRSVTLDGAILRVVTDPSATAPTDNYDITLVDEYGLDLFISQGLNRDTANSEVFVPGASITDGTTTSVIPVCYSGTATLTIANAGDTKVGTVVIYTR